MGKREKKEWVVPAFMPLGGAVLAGWWWHDSCKLEKHLQTLLADCDRVVIELRRINPDTGKRSVEQIELPGAEKVSTFVAAANRGSREPFCKCRGNPRLTFYQGTREVAKLSIDHGDRLKFLDHSEVQYRLSSSSSRSIISWFQDNGCAWIDDALVNPTVSRSVPANP